MTGQVFRNIKVQSIEEWLKSCDHGETLRIIKASDTTGDAKCTILALQNTDTKEIFFVSTFSQPIKTRDAGTKIKHVILDDPVPEFEHDITRRDDPHEQHLVQQLFQAERELGLEQKQCQRCSNTIVTMPDVKFCNPCAEYIAKAATGEDDEERQGEEEEYGDEPSSLTLRPKKKPSRKYRTCQKCGSDIREKYGGRVCACTEE